jgi:translation initiation factor IF-3
MEVRKIESRVNRQIRSRSVRVIDEDGNQLGIMSPQEGLKVAQEKELDLVEVAPNSSPPVCKIMNYGKYLYDQRKRAREAKKRQKSAELKEIRLKYDTGKHDYNFKLKHAEEFLRSGKKVKVNLIFRGREVVHANLGQMMLERFAGDLSHVGIIEQYPRKDGRLMTLLLVARTDIGEKNAKDEDQQER